MWWEVVIFCLSVISVDTVCSSSVGLCSTNKGGWKWRKKGRERLEQLMHGNFSQKGLSHSALEECAVKVNFRWKNNLHMRVRRLKVKRQRKNSSSHFVCLI